MEVKFDTREKFSVVTPIITDIHDKEAAELSHIALQQLESHIKNVIFNFSHIQSITKDAAQSLVPLYHYFLENNVSLVFCHLQPEVTQILDELGILDILNVTPTESEAWDIVQMEEMEREMFDDKE